MKPTKTLACASALLMLLGSAAYAQTTTSPSASPSGTTALTAEQCKLAINKDKPECAKFQAQAPSSSTGSSGSMGTTGSGSVGSGSSGSSSMGAGSSTSGSSTTKTK